MVVEDTRTLALQAEALLRSINSFLTIDVTIVETLTEAFAIVEDFDVIVLDLNLPDSEGFDTLRSMRKRTRKPIILHTTEELDTRTRLALAVQGIRAHHKGDPGLPETMIDFIGSTVPRVRVKRRVLKAQKG